jgi:Tol biopolymer transport system component
MPTVDDELTQRFQRAERPVDGDDLFEGFVRRRAHRERLGRVQAGLVAFGVIAATAGGFVALGEAFEPDDRSPAVSPSPNVLPSNGEIVFSAGGADGFVHLYAMQQDGSGRRQITDFGTDDTAPAVSPDGRTIAFVHQLEEAPPAIATIKIDGGVVTWLMDADFFVTDGPTWSPDGTKIAFAATHGEGQRIYVMGADGSDPRPITPEDVYWPDGPSWSPDGAKIAFAASPISGDEEPSVWDIYTISPDGEELTNVTQTSDRLRDEGGPTWSPDGESIAFTRNGSEGSSIVIRRLSDGVETQVTDGTFVEGSPAWSPDGRWIAFDRAGVERDPGEHPAQQDVWLVHPDGTGEMRLTTNGAFAPTWQPIPAGSITPAPTPSPEPSPSPAPSPKPEQDVVEIGLPFRLCHATQLNGVDFLADGTRGIAWVGVRARENGTCSEEVDAPGVVAADVHGDGIADVVSETIEYCYFCRAFDRVDLDVDGAEELVVLSSEGTTPRFMIYAVTRTDGDLAIAPLRVAEPGHPEARIDPGAPLTFSTGGDEGFAGWVGCDGAGGELILEVRWRDHPIEGDTQEVHETGLALRQNLFHVVRRQDYSLPAGSPVPGASDEPACGVDWQL